MAITDPFPDEPKDQDTPAKRALRNKTHRRSFADEMSFLKAAKRAVPDKEWQRAIRACLARIVETGDAHALLALAKVLPGALAPTKTETTIQARPALPLAVQGIADRLDALCAEVFAPDGKTIDLTVLPALPAPGASPSPPARSTPVLVVDANSDLPKDPGAPQGTTGPYGVGGSGSPMRTVG